MILVVKGHVFILVNTFLVELVTHDLFNAVVSILLQTGAEPETSS